MDIKIKQILALLNKAGNAPDELIHESSLSEARYLLEELHNRAFTDMWEFFGHEVVSDGKGHLKALSAEGNIVGSRLKPEDDAYE